MVSPPLLIFRVVDKDRPTPLTRSAPAIGTEHHRVGIVELENRFDPHSQNEHRFHTIAVDMVSIEERIERKD